MKVPAASQTRSLEVAMTPMIDVVFLLLVFFVWTSSFERPEYDLPGAITLPPEGNSESAPQSTTVEAFDEIVIRILNDQSNSLLLNGETIDGEQELANRLTSILALGVQPPIIIDPDASITMERTIAIYDVARLAGGDRVLFAARDQDDVP